MATIDLGRSIPPDDPSLPRSERYRAAEHYRDRDHEFDSVKMGVWLFLATEILLFSGMFVGYGLLRMLHPEAFINGSHYLDVGWGLLNTVVLLFSSYTVACAVRAAQLGRIKSLKLNIIITLICGLAFLVIKFVFEYGPKFAQGKLPGKFFSYPNAHDPNEPLWWGIYWGATGIHATHVVVGIGLFIWLYWLSARGAFGPKHYTAVEGVGLYWHIVDIVWIFLFPLLYLIH
ncbi:MAG: cytochrome c oxidase subunit 3 family protein [Phycisphaeraceae bacterium]|nr:cytochrome c oxidase subunit 3 family protein [Phycisphaeraceae bacterium]